MKTMNKPTDEEITSFIQEMSPEKSKCLHRDFVNLVGFSILAWVVDASLNKEKELYIRGVSDPESIKRREALDYKAKVEAYKQQSSC